MLADKDNGFRYVGSSISSANRLSVGCLGPNPSSSPKRRGAP